MRMLREGLRPVRSLEKPLSGSHDPGFFGMLRGMANLFRKLRIGGRVAVACLLLFPLFASGATTKKTAPKKPSSAKTVKAKAVPGKISTAYRSPRNAQRALRKSTQFIILHTTEGSSKGSLEKLSKNGECNYVVDTDGAIYVIIERGRIAYHAGLSMWNGKTGLDSCSVGIEIVGYHNKDLTEAQYTALKKLLDELKSAYRVPDEKVLTHSMVAYGNPNHWQKSKHRGRKRCGMLLALPAARAKLGLLKKPAYDPDLKAKRLVDADPELTTILYRTTYSPLLKTANQKPATPPKPSAAAQSKPASAPTVAATAPSPASATSPADTVLVPACANNVIGPKRPAWNISKERHNKADTIYVYPDGTQKSGVEIKNWKSLPAGTKVFFRQAAPAQAPAPEPPPAVATTTPGPEENLAAPAPEPANNIIGPKRSAWDIARDQYNAASTIYVYPDGTRVPGDQIPKAKWKSMPAGTRVEFEDSSASENANEGLLTIGEDGTAQELAGDAMAASTTFYFPPNADYRAGSTMSLAEIDSLPAGTRVLLGYKQGGPISAKLPVFSICGPRWNQEDTYYWTKGKGLVSGDEITERSIPSGARVFYR